MAELYLARRRAGGIEKWLVVKRMRPEIASDPRLLDLFVREARLSMTLVHQNIVPVFDFGRVDDQVYFAMERVEGYDLGLSLARAERQRVPPLIGAFIAAECCQALDYVHRRRGPDGAPLGIVHRDVTPRNVLLSWSGEVKLSDFGIAARAGDTGSRLLGTPHYMAPEQARKEPIDARADLYALGLVLREAVTGVCPRPGGDRQALLGAARRAELSGWDRAALPPALVAIIERATAALPCDRYPDAEAMLADLDGFIVGYRAAHRAPSPARQLAAWLARVWDGARDDRGGAAGSDAEFAGFDAGLPVGFGGADDPALDRVGAGTARSLAATADDDGALGAIGEIAARGTPLVVESAALDTAQPGDAAAAEDAGSRARGDRAAAPPRSAPS
jgi:serine/threonine protein kinase